VHVDQTARVQTVDPGAAPAFAALIEHFHQITGIPVVLNTSFNDREPIVETPAHALATPGVRSGCRVHRGLPRRTGLNELPHWTA
jgi:predicted NodU family carbamoyl transferase